LNPGARATTKSLVTGTSAVGKSSVAEELSKRGHSAWDADEHAAWLDDDDRPLEWWECRIDDPEWVKSHRWEWETDWIDGVLASDRDEYVCGSSSSLYEYVERFDRIYLLTLDVAIQNERLEARTNNDFGRDPAIRDLMRSWEKIFTADMLELGAIQIDASKPLADVVDEILSV
jgi:dephospho-CoA kinase